MGALVSWALAGPRIRNALKISVTGPSFLVNCYLEIKFHKNQGEPPLLNDGSQNLTKASYKIKNMLP